MQRKMSTLELSFSAIGHICQVNKSLAAVVRIDDT